ncbi:unnamed protein product [Closterium sp. NIES-53]
MAAQELRWLTFLLGDLGERSHTAPTLFADNKAMILLCRKPRLETRVKHIDVRYFLLRELQRRGLVRLDFVASDANTTDLITKALAPGVRGPLSEGFGFESPWVHFEHPSAGGCQRSTGDPRLILGKGYRLVVTGGYGRTDPLFKNPFYPNGLVVGILTPGDHHRFCVQLGLVEAGPRLL